MRKKEEILKALHSIKLCLMAHPDNEENSEFEIRINQIQEIEESIPKYADEFACAFAEWKDKLNSKDNPDCFIEIKYGISVTDWEWKIRPNEDLLEIFKKEINGKV